MKPKEAGGGGGHLMDQLINLKSHGVHSFAQGKLMGGELRNGILQSVGGDLGSRGVRHVLSTRAPN